MILGAAASLLGLLLNLKPFESAAAMMMLLVITLLIDGIQNLWLVLSTVKAERKTIINAKKWRVYNEKISIWSYETSTIR